MVKDRSGWEDACKEHVAAVDGEADVLSRLRACRVPDYQFWNVGALAADQRAADISRTCIERHSLRQWRIVDDIRA